CPDREAMTAPITMPTRPLAACRTDWRRIRRYPPIPNATTTAAIRAGRSDHTTLVTTNTRIGMAASTVPRTPPSWLATCCENVGWRSSAAEESAACGTSASREVMMLLGLRFELVVRVVDDLAVVADRHPPPRGDRP